MSAGDIVLVIISGLGVIHGLFLSIFLWMYNRGNATSNKILSALLIILSFRVGKSVFLEFLEDLDVKFVFGGLATIMAIGPIFLFLVKSCISKSFRIESRHYLHFIPALIGISFGVWLTDERIELFPLWFFALVFLFYYMHYLVYLIIAFRKARQSRDALNPDNFDLLRLLFYSLLGIWFVYVLNIFDDAVPYIVGPLLYSLVAYVVSFIVIRKGYMEKIDHSKYKTTPASDEQIENIYAKVLCVVKDDSQFRNPDLTLKSLSESLHVSTQMLSMAINQKSQMNFNNFINSFRIEQATNHFKDPNYDNHTVASIAFDVGFNSISSFNTAFKKQMAETPQEYRKSLSK